jgi:phosphopantothenoylcysteine decarboxylase
MNTSMWYHPLTARHMDVIKDILGFIIIDPISKKLACGDTGIGAMAEYTYISDCVLNLIKESGLTGMVLEKENNKIE